MAQKKSKFSKGAIASIIIAALAAVTVVALLITNIFVPVKYLASYLVLRNKGVAEGEMRVAFLDVGYGDCTVIELPDGKNMLIDGGNGRLSNTSRILKYLNQHGIDTIDYLVCSSVNAEHCGGLAEIIKYKQVKTIYSPYCVNSYVTDEYRAFTVAAEGSGAKVRISEYGAGEKFEGGFFKFLSPSVHTNPMGEYAAFNSEPSAENRSAISSIIWLEYAGTSFLLTGDANDGALTAVCNSYLVAGSDYPVKLENCSVLKLAAHGAKNSACEQLFSIIKPKTAVLSVGENGYGNPSEQALTNALGNAENLLRTDEHGTVTVEVTKDSFKTFGENI